MILRCPGCNRFLAEGSGYTRAVCPKCAITVTATPKVPATP